MRIVFLCNEYPPDPGGGIGSFVQTMARALASRGHAVTSLGFSELHRSEMDQGVRVVRLKPLRVRGAAWLLNRLRIRAWLEREMRENGVDIVEAPEFLGSVPWPMPVPVVVRLHLSLTLVDLSAGNRPRLSIRALERATLASHPDWIAVSRHALALTTQTFGVHPRRCATIYSPITPRDPSARGPDVPGPFVLFAGTVSERKGALQLAAAARIFLAQCPRTYLVFAGRLLDREGRPIARDIDEIVGPERSRIRFTGPLARDSLRELMSRASVFAYPSTLETFGLVVAEAMREGCPVVVPQSPPFDEFVVNGETGLTVTASDPSEFANAVKSLLLDTAKARRIAAAGRLQVENRFQLANAVAETLSFYREVSS